MRQTKEEKQTTACRSGHHHKCKGDDKVIRACSGNNGLKEVHITCTCKCHTGGSTS